MRLLLVSEYFPDRLTGTITGGVEARAWFLSRLLAARHDVTVITSWQKGQPRFETIQGVQVYRPGPHHEYANEGRVGSRLGFALAAYRQGRELGSFDVVEGCNFIAYQPAYFVARRVGARAVATYNEVWCGSWIATKGPVVGVLGELWERWTLRLPWDRFVAISRFTANRLTHQGIAPGLISVIPCGVDLAEIQRIASGSRLDGSMCMVGRLVKGKQPHLPLYALGGIARSHPDVFARLHLTVCGDGPLLHQLKALSAALGLADRVRFTGRLPNYADVLRLMKESSLLLHPSTVEGFGIVPVEACACGTPVLTADIAVFQEVSAQLGGGRTFRSGSIEDLAQQIVDHFTGYPIPVGQADQLDWTAICRQLEECYRGLLERGSD
jgi:glycosyltransferase involved in cell wall biosynthesis